MTGHISPTVHPFLKPENSKDVSVHPAGIGQGNTMSFKLLITKWFGLVSTLILGAMALAPDILHVSPAWRPWIFVIFIAWVFAFCAGLFDPWTDQ